MSFRADPSGRQSWDEYFLTLAEATASRSNCVRRRVGAVIVRARRIQSTGYNGPPSGYGHCDVGSCPRGTSASHTGVPADYDDCVAIHAEANALLFAGPAEREGASLYTTAAPCFGCAKLIANSGLSEVVASGGRYAHWEHTRSFLQDCGVRVRVLDGLEHAVALPLEG